MCVLAPNTLIRLRAYLSMSWICENTSCRHPNRTMKGVWDMTQGSLMLLWKQLHFWIALQQRRDISWALPVSRCTLH